MTSTPKCGMKGRAAVGLCGILAVAILALEPGGPLIAQEDVNGVIAGRVTDPRGQPQRVMVQLLSPGEILADQTYTDSNGRFAFNNLRSGVYYITIEAEGYRPVRQSAQIDARSNSRTGILISLEAPPSEPNSRPLTIAGSKSSYALNVKNKSRPFDAKAMREFDKGNHSEQGADFQSAIAHYLKAIKIEPDFYPALNNLGAIYLRQKDFVHAELAFSKSLQENPEDSEAYINLGHVAFERAEYPLAIQRLEEGLKRTPESPVGHFLLGSAYLRVGKIPQAEENLKAACTLTPTGMPSAHLQLANLYLKQGDMTAAGVQLQEYLQANPSDPQAPAIKKMLDSITAKRTN